MNSTGTCLRALLNKHIINESLRKCLFLKKKKKSSIGHVHSNAPEVSKETSAMKKLNCCTVRYTFT